MISGHLLDPDYISFCVSTSRRTESREDTAAPRTLLGKAIVKKLRNGCLPILDLGLSL